MYENRNFWEEFIELYRKHRCLWDIKSADYSNKLKRNNSYNVLLQKLKEVNRNVTLDLLKKKINNMRTTFRREFKKVQESIRTTGADNVYEPNLWYYDLLLFLVQCESDSDKKKIVLDDATENEDDSLLTGRCEPDHWKKKITIDDTSENKDEPQIVFSDDSDEEIQIHTPQTSISEIDSHSTRTSISSVNELKYYKKRLRPHINEAKQINKKRSRLLNFSHNTLLDEDEYEIAGKRIGYQLRALDVKQRIVAEKLISDVIYYGRLGKLGEDTSIRCKAIS